MAISTIDTSIKPSPSCQSSPSPHHQSPSSFTSTTTTSPTSAASPSANGVGGTSRNVPILPAPKDASSSVPVKVEPLIQVPKKRRIPGACDICKKKKSQCLPFSFALSETNANWD
jgi:hypothetical protein